MLLVHPVVPPNGPWSGNDEHAYAASFISAQLSAGDLRSVTFTSRLVPLAETVGVAFVLFALALELFGPATGALAGLLAGALWLTSPFVLGIGHLDGVDVPFTLAIALSSWALVRWLHRRTLRALGWLGLAFAAVAGSQISGLLVVASGLAVVLVAQGVSLGRPGAVRALGHTVLAGLICVAGLWLSYLVVDPSVLTHVTLGLPHPYVDGAHYLKSQDTIGTAGYVAGVALPGRTLVVLAGQPGHQVAPGQPVAAGGGTDLVRLAAPAGAGGRRSGAWPCPRSRWPGSTWSCRATSGCVTCCRRSRWPRCWPGPWSR